MKLLAILFLVNLVRGQGDLESLIKEVYPGSGDKSGSGLNLQPSNPVPGTGDCTCVPYYLCANNTIIKDGVGLIDIRIKDGPCANYIEVCCEEGNKVEKPILPTQRPPTTGPDTGAGTGGSGTGGPGTGGPGTGRPVTGGPGTGGSVTGGPGTGGPGTGGPGTGGSHSGAIGTGPDGQYHSRGCGYRNPEGVGFRITGDKDSEAQFAEFPWMVAVLREDPIEGSDKKLNVYQCGGSLIHPNVVVTAGHCVSGKTQGKVLKVRAGEWDTQTKQEVFQHQDREVGTVIVHPHFHAGALFNDIALLILKSPFHLADNVDLICLPPKGAVVDHKKCYASGWGRDVFGKEGKYQVILKKVELPIVPNAKCQENLRQTRLGKFFELDRSFICAGGVAGKDTCKGDGGSPLVCPIPGKEGRYYQTGIVAWGIGCGENNIPGVYANVAHFRDWIDEQMEYQRFEKTSYNNY